MSMRSRHPVKAAFVSIFLVSIFLVSTQLDAHEARALDGALDGLLEGAMESDSPTVALCSCTDLHGGMETHGAPCHLAPCHLANGHLANGSANCDACGKKCGTCQAHDRRSWFGGQFSPFRSHGDDCNARCPVRPLGVNGPIGIGSRLGIRCRCGRGCRMCGVGCGRMFGCGLFGARHRRPTGDMMGHTPYQARHMYYYFRPYQFDHVMELQEESIGSAPDSLNAWQNQIFDRISQQYAERFEVDPVAQTSDAARQLEFVGRRRFIAYNELPQKVRANSTEHAEESMPAPLRSEESYFEAPSPSDLDSPDDIEPHVSEYFLQDRIDFAEIQRIDPAVRPRRQ